MHVLERICIFCLRMCIMSQSQLRESASVWSHRVSGGVRAVFQRFCQCLDSQAFVLSCHPYEASPDYEKGFSGHPKRLFRAVIRCFLLCGGDVSGMRESLYGSTGECFQCSCPYYYTHIIHIRQASRSWFTKMFCHDFLLSADV